MKLSCLTIILAIFAFLFPGNSQDRLIVCGGSEVYILPHRRGVAKTDAIWSWTASDSPEIPTEMHRQFRSTDECKPVGGNILITSSSGGVALIRRSDKACLFYASAKNAHSACLLPGNLVAVAASFGGDELQIFDRSQLGMEAEPIARTELFGAHGAVWDTERRRIWALGTNLLLLLRLDEDRKLIVEASKELPTVGGHDLSPAKQKDILFVSSNTKVYRFDCRDLVFSPMHPVKNEAKVKSIDQHPVHGRIVWHKGTGETWWSDTVRFLAPVESIVLPGERIYKVRWDVADADPQ